MKEDNIKHDKLNINENIDDNINSINPCNIVLYDYTRYDFFLHDGMKTIMDKSHPHSELCLPNYFRSCQDKQMKIKHIYNQAENLERLRKEIKIFGINVVNNLSHSHIK